MINNYKGAVSLFVVVFTTLLITIITVSFIRITIVSEQQSSSVDLSKSAYDSAQAGVEDAKRALIEYEKICTDRPASECSLAKDKINSTTCNTPLSLIYNNIDVNSEIIIRQAESDAALDQAYTCVTITSDTEDFLGKISADDSKTVPLRGVSYFDRVKIDWFTSSNIGGGVTSIKLESQPSIPFPLYENKNYPKERPPILRAQLVQVGSEFVVEDISSPNYANAVFLYPVKTTQLRDEDYKGTSTSFAAAGGARLTPTKSPSPVECRKSLVSGGYACTVIILLPDVSGSRNAMLQLMPLYNSADFRVQLYKENQLVKFANVQPNIDSTGRANDLFRRVQVRVERPDTFPYPNAALEVGGNVCKNFSITDNQSEYDSIGECNPIP